MAVQSKFVLEAGALPYSDGSGDQVVAKVETTDEGVMLSFEVTHHIPVDKWPEVRDMIQHLVQSSVELRRDRSR